MSALSDPTMVEAGAASTAGEQQPTAPEADVGASAGLAEPEAQAPPEPLDAEPAITLPPFPPLPPLPRRLVHGRYRSGGIGFELELRVDVGGVRPMNRVSGDFFQTSGGTTSYVGSFVVNAPTISITPGQVRLEGLGSFTFSAGAPQIRVTIPRRLIVFPPGDATVQFFTTAGTPGATYVCPFVSPSFRSIQWEQDSVAGAVPFVSYDTGLLPQPPTSPARVLTVPQAYAEAGLEVQVAGAPNVINTSAAGPNATWSDSELHSAMVSHFSLFANVPQWRVWLLVATAHDGGYRGIMFDYSDSSQRQGCAVFYDAIQGTDAASQRAQLRTYVHELGHAFNLLHSWEKNLADPPQPLGPNSGLGDLSWMNYTWRYQPPPPALGGEAAYWAAFPFQFTDNEIVHLRHGFYRNVIMGGNPFGTGAAEVDPGMFDEPIVDNSGLLLELRSKEAFEYGEPVVVELKLSTTDLRGRATHDYLHPNNGLVSIAIHQPSGQTVVYRPLLPRCVDEARRVQLDSTKRPAIYQSAYIGYGRDGFYFQQPGPYTVRAQYVADDGSRVVSQVLRLMVRSPLSRADQQVAELMMGEEQGQLFYLLGSDSDALRAGNEALDVVLDQHGDHPLAVYARLVKGINAERDFKNLTVDKSLQVRPAEAGKSIQLLSSVVEASTQEQGVDNITLNTVMRRLARAEAKAGNTERVGAVMDRMVDVFSEKGLNPYVMQKIRDQADATKAALASEAGKPRRPRRKTS
jgi:hypothetical protein